MSNETTELLFKKSLPDYVWSRKLLILKQKAPFDYLVLGLFHNAFEIKECKRGRFSFKNDIKPHQYAGLMNFYNKGARFRAYVFIAFKGEKTAFFIIPIKTIWGFKTHKSVTLEGFRSLFCIYEKNKGFEWFHL